MPWQKNIPHRFNNNKKVAGQDWYIAFTKAIRLSLRTPEATSLGRLMDVRIKYGFSAGQIFNADESGISTVPTRLPKILTPTGIRRRKGGKNTTVVCAMNALGVYIPPFFIFARKRMKPELLNGCPPGSVGIAQSTGWMTTDSFIKYLQHFVNHAKPSAETPVWLIVDNHTSHVSLECVNFCRSNNIILLGLPPHTTHRLQPLYVAFFGPLKSFYNQACDSFMVNHPGIPITDRNFGPMLGEAYGKAATVNNAVKGFRACGVEPFNPNVFEESDFAPSATSERDYVPVVHITGDDDNNTHNTDMSENSDYSSDDNVPLNQIKARALFTPSKNVIQSNSTTGHLPAKRNLFSFAQSNSASSYQDKEGSSDPIQPSCSKSHSTCSEPGTSKISSVSKCSSSAIDSDNILRKIRPLPTIQRSVQTKRKKQSASIISSTPVKNQLEEKQRILQQKEEKRNKRQNSKILYKSPSVSRPTQLSCFCLVCHEAYSDPPIEDWIQCSRCQEWCHEDCSAYEGQGDFICDFCL
ncbi:hypothetical protein NQ318_023602 [Aromia moschata]|uniref:Zinc finger PHD-type domain-containing protein n=1 Tax=Aromia moschata TaxID=1265417 RepID=A0AAV8YPN3_9CUCU|nr:hypothetical protein NQ318_023602 [Aromia moschata]